MKQQRIFQGFAVTRRSDVNVNNGATVKLRQAVNIVFNLNLKAIMASVNKRLSLTIRNVTEADL
jgi:hypothetical protein